ncbi:MAG: hypothetical protein KF887_01635 [Paracoccaceae bacterium]|nr:MAG: hypothetical protein KF887_01635 [Paracoccaceae bacterium]
MRLIRLALIVIVLLAIVAALTRPGPAEFDAMLDAAIRERVANTDLDASGAPLPTIALAACKMRPTDCVSLVRDTLDVTFEEGIFVTRATVEGFGRTATCRGAFGRFVCDREVAG